MRTHFSRPAFFEGARHIAPMLVGIVPFGIVCGIGAIAAGASPLAARAMSMFMFCRAALIVAIVPISILIAVFQERVVGGLTAGGVKG